MEHKLEATITFEYIVNYDNEFGYTCADDEEKAAKNCPDEWSIDSGFDIERSKIRVELIEPVKE